MSHRNERNKRVMDGDEREKERESRGGADIYIKETTMKKLGMRTFSSLCDPYCNCPCVVGNAFILLPQNIPSRLRVC